MIEYLSLVDLIVPPILLIVIYLVSRSRQSKNIDTNPSYRFYLWGIWVKVIGGVSVCLIYILYYGFGDTLNYYNDCVVMVNMLFAKPTSLLEILLGTNDMIWYEFTDETGYMVYIGDPHAIVVDKICWLLCLVTFKSFIGTTILLAWISYAAIWRLYQVFVYEFPALYKEFAVSLLFIPSVFFWGSGLLKDTITFSSVCLFASSFSILMTRKEAVFKNVAFLIISSLLLIWIKPYIFFALLPGSVLWYGGIQIFRVDNHLVKSLTTPFLITISMLSGYVMLALMSGFLGDYSIENVLDKAVLTQNDLKSEYYMGSSFDIGSFEPTVAGILSKMPAAINAALFRPYLWETYNMTMLMSGMENLGMLIFTIFLVIKLKVYNLFRLMFRHRILFFTVYFSIFFAFSVGLTTSNFGSLVRYKIPAIPFFLISLFIISYTYKELKKEDEVKMEAEESNRMFRLK
jgi:hypothetical protein